MSIVPIGGIRNRPCTPARLQRLRFLDAGLRRRLHDAAEHDRLVAELLERDLGELELLALRQIERFAASGETSMAPPASMNFGCAQ